VAWWVESWDGWGERTAEQNRRLRECLLANGHYDGYLLFDGDEPAAWSQVGRRDRLVKLVNQMKLLPDSETWAITCFLVAPAYRRQGIARHMLKLILADLQCSGITAVEAYPKRGANLDAADLWNGPETMFISAGFEFIKEVAQRAVLRMAL
jgi:ribosomal protein S18 acetylase RimI-like enzyme